VVPTPGSSNRVTRKRIKMVRPTRWCAYTYTLTSSLSHRYPHLPPAMGVLEIVTLALTHPQEFRILLQFWNYHERKRDITRKEEHASSGWDRQTMRRCWELLDFTSRSFASVIKELEGDLARVVSSFVRSLPLPLVGALCIWKKNQST
jgi:hypothetical protein